MSEQLLSLAEGRAALNLSSTADDDEVLEYIEATTDLIESRIGPVIPRSVTSITAGPVPVLPVVPVLSVQSIAGIYSGATYLPADVTVLPLSGVLTLTSRAAFANDTYTVTYTAGRSGTIPPRILQAAKVLLQHLWTTQRGSSNRPRGDVDTYAPSYSLPNRVVELLQFDMKIPSVA